MPSGLQNTPGTFQQAMHVILSTVKYQFALVYLDVIVIFSRTPDEHILPIHTILNLIRDSGVTLKLKKIHFFTETIDYFGKVIRPRRLEIASHTDEIRDLNLAINVTERK